MKITESQLRRIVREEFSNIQEAPKAGRGNRLAGGGGFEDSSDTDAGVLGEVLKILLDVLDNDYIDENAERKIRRATSYINGRGIFSK